MKSFLGLLVIVAVFVTGEAVKCYDCNTRLNSKCVEVFDSSVKWNTTDKSVDCQFCTKAVAVMKNETYTERGCIAKPKSNLLVDFQPNITDIVRVSTFLCNTELCNGTNSITAGLSTLIILSIASIFMSRN